MSSHAVSGNRLADTAAKCSEDKYKKIEVESNHYLIPGWIFPAPAIRAVSHDSSNRIFIESQVGAESSPGREYYP